MGLLRSSGRVRRAVLIDVDSNIRNSLGDIGDFGDKLALVFCISLANNILPIWCLTY
jgi:hypothetical protein